MIFPGYPFRRKPEACTSYNYKYYGMGEENMIDKLLKAISLKDEDSLTHSKIIVSTNTPVYC